MRFELTPDSQRRFGMGLAQVAQRLNKSLLDLLRQTAVYYAQAARKRTPGNRYAGASKTMKLRNVIPIPQSQRGQIKTPRGKVALYWVDAWIGPVGNKKHVLWPTRSRGNIIRYIRYYNAAQVSWNSILQKLFGTSPINDIQHFPHVDTAGCDIQLGHTGNFRPFINTENKLGYIARLRPGIAGEALIAAQNRVANGYIKRLGDGMRQTWEKA